MAEYGTNKIMQIVLTDKDGHQIWELVNYYRLISKMTWTGFMLTALMHYISLDNEMIAQAIKMYMDKKERTMVRGRPAGRTQPKEWKKAQSERMKQYWKERKAYEQSIKENNQ